VNDCCHTDSFVAVRADHRIYARLFYSYPVGHCRHRFDSWIHSAATRVIKQSSCIIKA
jgi:hypothetical protein